MAVNSATLLDSEARFEWLVNYWDFQSTRNTVGVSQISPMFSSGAKNELTWYMKVYPCGVDQNYKDKVSLYVALHKSTDATQVRAKFRFSVYDDRGYLWTMQRTWNVQTFVPGVAAEITGFHNFTHRTYLQDDTAMLQFSFLKIVCELKEIVKIPNKAGKSDAAPFTIPKCRFSMNLRNLFESKKFSDVTLLLSGQTFLAHKVILAMHSPVFSAMFEHDLAEKINDEVKITDVKPEAFNEMLRFMYTGEVTGVEKIADSLLVAADKYDLERLKAMCEEALYKNINVENSADMLILADKHSADQLKPRALKFIASCTTDVMDTPGFQSMIQSHPHLIAEALHELAVSVGRKAPC